MAMIDGDRRIQGWASGTAADSQDTMAFAAFVSGFFGTRVSWRGSRYRVLADGSVVQESN